MVYAVEASDMAHHARQLCASNASVGGDRVVVKHCKVEDFEIPQSVGKADILISEPMGTLLVNERMIESYIAARDQLLKPDGLMFPSYSRIHVALFSDEYLHAEMVNKPQFWQEENFYGLNLSCLYRDASKGYFEQVRRCTFSSDLLDEI